VNMVEKCDRNIVVPTDRQTDTYIQRHTTTDLIVCPMLWYSNGTDNNYDEWKFSECAAGI